MNTLQNNFPYLSQEDIDFELSEVADSLKEFMKVSYEDALYYCKRVALKNRPQNVIDAQIVAVLRERNSNKKVLFRVLKGNSSMFNNSRAAQTYQSCQH